MKKFLYLILAVAGAIIPYSYLVPFIQENGFAFSLLIDQMFLNYISSFFVFDVIISAVVLLTYICFENIKEPIRFSWMAIIGTLTIGVSFGLPFFLFLKEVGYKKRKHSMLIYQAKYNRL